MSSYNELSRLYDVLTEDVNYKVRSDYISDFFIANGINNGTIIDLACGTGSFSKHFDDKGFNVIGVEISEGMLVEAQQKVPNAQFVMYPMQDYISSQEVDGVICCLDSINHLTNIDDVQKTFNSVFENLKSGGLFVFDVNTVYKHQKILSNNVFVFDEDDYYLVWENELLDNNEVRILLDMFIYNGENYDRYSEDFNEKAYSVQKLIDMLKISGFNNINVYDDLSLDSPKEDSERLYFVAKKE